MTSQKKFEKYLYDYCIKHNIKQIDRTQARKIIQDNGFPLDQEDLMQSSSRPSEKKWQQIVGNLVSNTKQKCRNSGEDPCYTPENLFIIVETGERENVLIPNNSNNNTSLSQINHVLNIYEIDESYIAEPRKERKTKRKKQTTESRQASLEKANKTGLEAEKIIAEQELEYLKSIGKEDAFFWASQESDDYGYDIKTLDRKTLSPITLEVKFVQNIEQPIFRLTYNERQKMEEPGALVVLVDKNSERFNLALKDLEISEKNGNTTCNEVEYRFRMKTSD